MFEGSIQKKEGLSWTTTGPGKNGYIFYHSNGSLSNKYSHGEEKLLCRRQGKRGNSFALVNYRKCCQEQTAVCSAGTDIFENRLCPYHNGEEL
jgi:hypothetical protein